MKVKCKHCEVEKPIKETSGQNGHPLWEVQWLHFGDFTVEYLTCDKCKKLNPMDFLAKLQAMEGK